MAARLLVACACGRPFLKSKAPISGMAFVRSFSLGTPEASNLKDSLTFGILNNPDREMNPSAFFGKIVLVVNTASLCGYTPQLGEMQTLWEK